jgi:pyruvoyl-dependent arginine decarboxylase (PvlArgDC)
MIPPNSIEISKKKGVKQISFGSVLECIMSKMDGRQGQKIFAGLLITKIHDENKKILGSFVIEYGDYHNDKKKALLILFHQLRNMIKNRGYGNLNVNHLKLNKFVKTDKNYHIYPENFIYDFLDIKKKLGSVIVAICFTKFI